MPYHRSGHRPETRVNEAPTKYKRNGSSIWVVAGALDPAYERW